MTAIEASSVRVSTMADGTLRVVLDVEPRHAQDAFRLFGSPGTPVALAALVDGAQEPEPEKPKGGPLAKLAGQWCSERMFIDWANSHSAITIDSSQSAAAWLRATCGVASRVELDHNPAAAERFHRYVRGPYSKYLVSIGVTT
jgi:hypothetical protein